MSEISSVQFFFSFPMEIKIYLNNFFTKQLKVQHSKKVTSFKLVWNLKKHELVMLYWRWSNKISSSYGKVSKL